MKLKELFWTFIISLLAVVCLNAQDFTKADYYRNLYSEGVLSSEEANFLTLIDAGVIYIEPDVVSFKTLSLEEDLSSEIYKDLYGDIPEISPLSFDPKKIILDVVSWVAGNVLGKNGLSMKECTDLIESMVDIKCRADNERLERMKEN